MNTIHHFGDSYGTVGENDTHFVELIAKKINYNYEGNRGVRPSSSNELMLNFLLYKIYDIKPGDMVFFNFSFFVRGCYYDKEQKKIFPTNTYYADGKNKDGKINVIDDYIRNVIILQLEYNEDYCMRLFHHFNTIFEQLHKRDIVVNYIFIEETPWCDELLTYGNKIKFDNGFSNWLHSMDYHREEECHYTRGVQELIYDEIMKQIILPKNI